MTPETSKLPIGVFDSGIGGLTVVRALMAELPQEDIIYFGDTARVPYGIKSTPTIRLFTDQIVRFLRSQKVKALVVACNTIAAAALDTVYAAAPALPVLDVIKAGAKAAVQASTGGKIGVIATTATVASNAYPHAVAALNPGTKVIAQACPLLVPLAEEGWLDTEVTRLTVRTYLQPLLTAGIDTLILGCTHYPLLKPALTAELPSDITLIDSAAAVASTAAAVLAAQNLRNRQSTPPAYNFYVSDLPLKFQTIGERFLGRKIEHLRRHILD